MKFLNTLMPLAAVSTAFVIPDEEITNKIVIQSEKDAQSFLDRLQGNAEQVWSGVEETFKDAVAYSENAIDSAIHAGQEAKSAFECQMSMTKFDMAGWLESETPLSTMEDVDIFEGHHHKPHHPHHPPHHGPPHHGGPHHKPNKTVYELIASSKYTTKLAKLINEYPDVVDALNGTAANYTVFAPTDKAFEKLPEHHKPTKEQIKKVLGYHVSSDFYPAGRVLVTHTIPTLLGEPALGDEPQRLRVGFSLGKGLNINFYSRIVAIDIFGTNGVIHGIDSLLLPPPPALKIIELFPSEFSTLQLGLLKTGLLEDIEGAHHEGGTVFAPSNWAFQKLGPKANAFLFSKYGSKYLKALLQYHVVANQTLYSDAFYKAKDVEEADIPKGHFHVDLPTLLEEKSLSIDIGRYGGFISMKINGFGSVSVQDGIAKDGVVHVVSSVIIPPKSPGAAQYEGGEISVEELMDRLEPYARDL